VNGDHGRGHLGDQILSKSCVEPENRLVLRLDTESQGY